MVGNTSAATSGSLRVAASLSVAAVVFPVSPRHQGAACSLQHISTISKYLVQDTSASAVVVRRGTVQWWLRIAALGKPGCQGAALPRIASRGLPVQPQTQGLHQLVTEAARPARGLSETTQQFQALN